MKKTKVNKLLNKLASGEGPFTVNFDQLRQRLTNGSDDVPHSGLQGFNATCYHDMC